MTQTEGIGMEKWIICPKQTNSVQCCRVKTIRLFGLDWNEVEWKQIILLSNTEKVKITQNGCYLTLFNIMYSNFLKVLVFLSKWTG